MLKENKTISILSVPIPKRSQSIQRIERFQMFLLGSVAKKLETYRSKAVIVADICSGWERGAVSEPTQNKKWLHNRDPRRQ